MLHVNKLSGIISFIKEKRKILASFFLIIGMFSSTIVVIIFSQRSQTYLSRASDSTTADPSEQHIFNFASSKGYFHVSLDQRQWNYFVEPDKTFGERAVFNLKNEYGVARVDIMEGESEKDLESLRNEIVKEMPATLVTSESVQFHDKPSYKITYEETILGEDVYYYQRIVKDGNNFFIIEEKVSQLTNAQPLVDDLLKSIYFRGESAKQVQGVSDSLTNLATVQLVDLIRPSIANIVYAYCLDIVNMQPQLSGLSKPRYNFCATTKGSGFIVNEEGVLATNGHVAKIYPEEALVNNILYEGNKKFTIDLIRGIFLSKGKNPTQAQVEDFYQQIHVNPQHLDRFPTEIFQMIGNKVISMSTGNEKYYVNLGNEPVKIDYQKMSQGDYSGAIVPSSTTYTASLLDFKYPNKYSFDAIVNKNYQRGADAALLQINNSNKTLFPALDLGTTENLREGSEIVIAGYPTLVEGQEDPRAAISYKTSTKPTVTKGIISSVKEDLSGKTVLQTDASVDHGTSGGPAFDSLGRVIGIATFAVESLSGNFNFLRDVREVKELMVKNNIENNLGELTDLWRKGLQSFRNQRFGEAIRYFKQVETFSPHHPTVKELTERSEEFIKKGESLEGIAGFVKGEGSNMLLVIFGSISLISFMSAGFLTLLSLFIKEDGFGSKSAHFS